jgi:hypothetical protein
MGKLPKDALVWFYMGRNWYLRAGWVMSLVLLPTPSLMTRSDDEGRIILAGLRIEIGLTWSEQLRYDRRWPKPRFRVYISSDADEIASRLASAA